MPSYEADISRFESLNTQVLGISVDSVPCNAAWAERLGGISYDLLSDFEPKGEVARLYGVYRPEGYSERALLIIDTSGRVVYRNIHEIGKQPDNEVIFDSLQGLS
jgi:peroxiredoxin